MRSKVSFFSASHQPSSANAANDWTLIKHTAWDATNTEPQCSIYTCFVAGRARPTGFWRRQRREGRGRSSWLQGDEILIKAFSNEENKQTDILVSAMLNLWFKKLQNNDLWPDSFFLEGPEGRCRYKRGTGPVWSTRTSRPEGKYQFDSLVSLPPLCEWNCCPSRPGRTGRAGNQWSDGNVEVHYNTNRQTSAKCEYIGAVHQYQLQGMSRVMAMMSY